MAVAVFMRVVCLLSAVPFVHIANGYTIPQCGSDGTLTVTETQSITLTCTGIRNNTMFWDLISSNRGVRGIALCTWTPLSCILSNSGWYEVSRTQYGTSTLTVTHTTWDGIAGVIRCGGGIDPSNIASCYLRVVSVTTTTTTTQTTRNTTRETPSNTAQRPTSTTTRDTRTTDQNTEMNDGDDVDDDDDDDDDDGLPIPVIAGGAGGVLLVIIAVVIAIVVWKKRCVPTYAKLTRRSQVIDTNIYTELEPQQQDSIDQAPEDYEHTTGHQS